MSIFGKKASASSRGASIVSETRKISTLYPEFYISGLKAAGKPVTEHNVRAVAQLTSFNLALNAYRWFDALGDVSARRKFDTQFNEGNNQLRNVHVPDDMIDFLWSWTSRIHPGLHNFVDSMAGTIVSSVAGHGDHLPADLWGQ